MNPFTVQFTRKKLSDAGIAFTLLVLLLGYFLHSQLFYIIAIFAALANVISPVIFYPFAVVWYAFARIMGHVMSALVLTSVFIILIIPFGIARKLIGKTKLMFPDFNKGNKSIMHDREQMYTSADIAKPF